MLVSGGKVIAIDSVKINKNDLKGDGVFEEIELSNARKEEINSIKNTANDAQSKVNSLTNRVNTIDNEVSTVKSDVETLKTNVNTVSAKTNANTDSINSIEADITNNIKPKIEQNTNNINTVSSNLSTLSGKAVTNIYGNNLSAYVEVADDGTRKYRIDVAPQISDTIINGKNGISAKKEGTSTWNIGLSADYLSANALNNLSGNWQNTYSAVSSNSATWNKVTDKVDTTAFTPVKNDVETLKANSAHSTLSSKNDYIKVTKDGVNYGVEFISADLATKTWVDRNYQEKGNYLSANALDNLSGKWQSTYNTVYTNSGDWQEVNKKLYTSAFEAISGDWAFSADVDKRLEDTSAWANATFQPIGDYLSADALDKIKETSGKWDSTYSSVYNNSANWNEVSAKLDKKDFDNWSAILDERIDNIEKDVDILKSSSAEWNEVSAKLDISSFSSVSSNFALKTEVQKEFEQTSAWVKDNFLSANALDEIKSTSSNWNDTYSAVTANSSYWDSAYSAIKLSSENWNLTYDRVKTSAEIWNTVVDKLDKDDFDAWSAKTTDWDVSAYSGVSPISIEQHKVSIDLSEYYKKTETSGADELDTKFGEIEDRFEPIETDVATLKEFSAHNVVESSNQYIDVQSGTNKFTLTFTSGDLATKTWVGEQLADFGGFVLSTATGDDHHPDVANPSNKKVYLIEDTSSPSPDHYREWIVTGTNPSTGWLCIGDTTMDLSDYYKKTETSGAGQIATEFTNTSAWANETFQPIGNYVTSGNYITPGSAWVLVNDNDNVQWSGLDVSELGKKYIVKSTNGSVKIGSATVGNVVTYDLSADNMPTISSEYMLSNYNSATNKYELSGAKIVGENGVSAEYNPATNEWNVGLEDYNDIGFAKYSSSANVYTASAVVDGYTEDLNVNPTKITLNNDQILLKTGFYHVDVQTNFTIANPDNNYYNVFVKSIPNAASITQMIDGSYAHTETVDLSFDIRITNDDTPLEISVEYFKTNETFAISNLNIHEIVSMPSQIEGGAGNYQAGDGITISNDTIAAKIGNGLEFNESNAIQVKLGEGLAFTDDQGIKAISIDPAGDVAEVVKSVEALQDELDTKITDNFPPAMITLADLQVATGTQYAPSNGGMLIGYLFTCPITHNIYVNNEKYQTKIGIYTKQWSGTNNRVILGIYEYNPDYVNPDTQQVGKTEALCDTGIIELQQGYAEYEIKNVGEKTDSIMTPGKFYYATIYLSYQAGDTNGITLFGAPGYNTQVNNLKPGITITNVNCIRASLYDNLAGYDPNLNFDKMGFSWEYNSYPPTSTTDPTTSQGIVEAHAAGRPYFAIRNVKKVGN